MSAKDQEIKKNINNATESTKDSIGKASDSAQEGLDKASKTAQEEVVRLRRELEDLRRKANPQIKKAEAFLTSPTSCSFYQGLVVGAGLVVVYAKFFAPPNSKLFT
ncbi:hypothetical protein [Absidia glauca]|uniref:Uncharacterized protein n=1 Tax=Absidia glauca TaxID=4829 RepID=A0A168LCW3_ABSGL|nr:hypothetical protein [Absidia glauca]